LDYGRLKKFRGKKIMAIRSLIAGFYQAEKIKIK
jgi:hypothetical protein